MNEVSTDMYKLGSKFVGMAEVKGAVHNPQILAMLQLDNTWPEGDEVPWCSAFVNYIAHLLGLPRTRSLSARSWLKAGTPIELIEARLGCDVVILERPPEPTAGHVGIFIGRQGGFVELLGGNQSDKVCISKYPESRVIGVRRLK